MLVDHDLTASTSLHNKARDQLGRLLAVRRVPQQLTCSPPPASELAMLGPERWHYMKSPKGFHWDMPPWLYTDAVVGIIVEASFWKEHGPLTIAGHG